MPQNSYVDTITPQCDYLELRSLKEVIEVQLMS